MTYLFLLIICYYFIIIWVVQAQDINTNKVQTKKENRESIKNVTNNNNLLERNNINKYVCAKNARIPIFSLPCQINKDCSFLGKKFLCCKSRCIQGTAPPKPEVKHNPVLFGWVDRICPEEPLTEIFDIKECHADTECLPRICCPDTTVKGEGKSYCRTAAAKFDRIPVFKPLIGPLENMMSYLQCTLPPPPVLDLFPKPCQSPLDCFPNLCCQEGAKRYCRPPKKSLVTLMVNMATNLGTSTAARRFIERITV